MAHYFLSLRWLVHDDSPSIPQDTIDFTLITYSWNLWRALVHVYCPSVLCTSQQLDWRLIPRGNWPVRLWMDVDGLRPQGLPTLDAWQTPLLHRHLPSLPITLTLILALKGSKFRMFTTLPSLYRHRIFNAKDQTRSLRAGQMSKFVSHQNEPPLSSFFRH